MRRLALAVMAVIVMLALPRICDAATINYSIQNYPADQNGATLSGTITTDGTIGNLESSDILSWSWTITPVGGTPFTLSSSDAGSYIFLINPASLVASASEITMGISPIAGTDYNFSLESTITGADLVYSRNSTSGLYAGATSVEVGIWDTINPSMGGTDPWVIAAVSSVPEPSTLALAGLGAEIGLACALARKRSARFTVVAA